MNIDQLVQWYGKPGAWMRSHQQTDVVIMGASAENILMAAQALASGQSAGIITAGNRAHAIAPHPFHVSASHAVFYDAIGAPVPPHHSDAEIWNDRANLLFELGWKKESVECCLRCLALDRDTASAWVNLGRYFMDPSVMDLSLATVYLKQALEIDPKRAKALANLGGVLFAQQQYSESIEFCKRALEPEPNDFHANYYLVGSILQLWDTYSEDERAQHLRTALSHARVCESQLDEHPEAFQTVDRTIRWLEAELARHGAGKGGIG